MMMALYKFTYLLTYFRLAVKTESCVDQRCWSELQRLLLMVIGSNTVWL